MTDAGSSRILKKIMWIGERGNGSTVSAGTALFCLGLLALGLASFVIAEALPNPLFGGDAAHRMHMAQYPAIRLDNRVWLPALQLHIWVLYLLQAPYFLFRLIPGFYYFASIVLVGMLCFNQTGRTRSSLAISLLLAFFFARLQMVLSLSASLMQEIIAIALFCLLLQLGALELKKKWWILIAAIPALLTRDTFWIYLFVVSLLNWKTILFDRQYLVSFLLLWAVPTLWLLMIPVAYFYVDGRFPEFPAEWPLGINKSGNQAVSNAHSSLSSLWMSLTKTGVIWFVAAVSGLWIALQAWRGFRGQQASPSDDFARVFLPFSLASLGIIYTLFILFDPFQATPGASRMSTPLIVHGLIWAIILLGRAAAGNRLLGLGALMIILAGMAPLVSLDRWSWQPRDYTELKQVQQKMEADLDRLAPGREARICIVDLEYFVALERLVTPTLYKNRIMVLQTKNASLQNCAVLIAPQDDEHSPGEGFAAYADYALANRSYTLYLPRENHGTKP